MENMEIKNKKSQLTGKKILITGGTGLVGSHLAEKLIKIGANVIIPNRSYDPHSYFATQYLNKKCVLVNGDVKNFTRIFDIITKYEVDYIFHLAAQPIVETAYYNPLETFSTNIMGTANILEAARLYGKTKAIIVASSDKAYGKKGSKYVETDPLKGDHPYESSKSSADLITQTYFKTYNLPVVITRFGNIYGEGDLNFSRLIPGIMQAIIENKVLKIRSNGKYIRDYLYVKDVVAAYLLLAKNINKVRGEAFNFGSNETLSVIQLVNKISKTLNKKIKYKILNTARNEIPYQSLDYSKIKTKLRWSPKSSLILTINNIFKWYKTILLNNQ